MMDKDVELGSYALTTNPERYVHRIKERLTFLECTPFRSQEIRSNASPIA
jgi:hypothetical protein